MKCNLCGCVAKVFEVNASSLRNKSQIIQELEGALNSHHVSSSSSSSSSTAAAALNAKNSTAKFNIDRFFSSQAANNNNNNNNNTHTDVKENKGRQKKRKISLRKEIVLSAHSKSSTAAASTNNSIMRMYATSMASHNESITVLSDDQDSSSSASSTSSSKQMTTTTSTTVVNIHKESLILFDEVDVVFREDVGFWSAVLHFVKRSRKPIILTTSDEFMMDKCNLNVERIDYARPRVDAAIQFLRRVARAEEHVVLDTCVLNRLLRECRCDMRRALVQLQALIQNSRLAATALSSSKVYLSFARSSYWHI